MTTKTSRFDLEWWVIEKRAIYTILLVVILSLMAGIGGLYVWKYGNPLARAGTRTDAPAGARFISYEGGVRVIRAATRQVLVARSDTQLYPGDTVQTQADGRARITMADGSTVVVRPDSTIIIRDNASTEGGKRTNVHVEVDSGQMLVRTEQQSEGTRNVIETPKTQNQIAGQTAASFGVNPEGTEEIRVNAGAVDSVNRAGDKISLQGGQYVSINQSGTMSKPQRLLEAPQPTDPHDLEKVFVGANGSATVALRWQKPPSGIPAYYRVEVATSPFFVSEGKVIERDQLATTQLNASDLRPGAYFWRIRATAVSGQTSDWSEPRKFTIAERAGGTSTVAVSNLTSVYLGGNVFIVRGKALPGTGISVSGREATAGGDGVFQVQITAEPGTREAIIQASDSQGNSTQYRVPLETRSSG